MSNILERIVETKRAEVAAAKLRRPMGELSAAVRDAGPVRNLFDAVIAKPNRRVGLIAEIKKKSPSAGLIRPDFDPVRLAQTYHAHGADALSVLTDEVYFDGSLDFIAGVRQAVPLPVLRKDFMIDAYQVYEARAAGADAVLLIGEVLEPDLLAELLALSHELGMTTLVEVHEAETLAAVLSVIPFPNDKRGLLGINNRNLKIQRTDLATTAELAQRAPANTPIVAESGISSAADVAQLTKAGARALLIGETFMRAGDVGAKVNEVMGPLPA